MVKPHQVKQLTISFMYKSIHQLIVYTNHTGYNILNVTYGIKTIKSCFHVIIKDPKPKLHVGIFMRFFLAVHVENKFIFIV